MGKFYNVIPPLFCVLAILFFTIGYSAFNNTAIVSDISSTVRPQTSIRITKAISTNQSDATITKLDFNAINTNNSNVSKIESSFSFSKTTASITYQIDIVNYGNVEMGLASITGLPSNLTYEITGGSYNIGDKICDNNNSSDCTLGAKKTINLVVKYKSGSETNTPNNFNINMDFTFKVMHKIYFDVTEIDSIIDGGTKTISLGSNAPNDVTVNGTYTSKTYSNPSLTITGVLSDIYISANNSGGNGGTWSDPVVDTTTTTYDPSNVPEGTTEYDNVEGKPKVTADANGNITDFMFTDTGTNGITFSNNKTFDSGVIAFSGNVLTIHLKVDMKVTTSENVGKYVLTAMEKVGTQGNSNLYGGFIWFFRKANEFDFYSHYSATIKSGWFGSSIYQISMTSSSNTTTFTMDLEYDSSNRRVNSFVFKQGNTTKTQTAKSSTYFPNSPFNATIHLGGVGVENDHSRDVTNMVVKEFSVNTVTS